MAEFRLEDLELLIAERANARSDSSYTRTLLDAGPQEIGKKLGEEAIETIIAALGKDQKAVMRESADLIYHLLVLLNSWGVPLSDVVAELGRRTGKSGLAEKAERNAS